MTGDVLAQARAMLQRIWGYDDFRGTQGDIVRTVAEGQHARPAHRRREKPVLPGGASGKLRPLAKGLDRKAGDDPFVLLLGLSKGQAGVDLQGFAGSMPAVRLDQGVIDALFLSQVNRKCRSFLCGETVWSMPASPVYRSSIRRIPRSL